jgi:hypothetical protein
MSRNFVPGKTNLAQLGKAAWLADEAIKHTGQGLSTN